MQADYRTENKSFMVYKDWEQYIEMLSDEEAGKLFRCLFGFAKRGEEPELSGMLKMAFIFMKSAIERDGKKWEETVERRRVGGKKGGRPSKPSDEKTLRFSEKPQGYDIDIDTDKDTETDNDTETDEDTATEKVKAKETEKGTVREEVTEHFVCVTPCGRNENVELSMGELEELVSLSSVEKVRKYINKLSDWLCDNEKECYDCYGVIKRWIIEDNAKRPKNYPDYREDAPSFDYGEFEDFAMKNSLCKAVGT